MILKLNGTGPMFLGLGKADIGRSAVYPCMVLHNDAIVNKGYKGVGAIGGIRFKAWSFIDYIINIPFARLFHGIYKGGRLLVNATGLTATGN